MTEASPTLTSRAFISYSWSSPTHESWVLDLATRLREDGVDVILDKWDLKPGHDAYKFMESMVTDPTVSKVIMVCDQTYAEKANKRSGGVGAESQIISPEIYNDGRQEKFAALMTDQDENGDANVPVFYKARIYFDFRSADRFEESYEQLLRWLINRPLHVKPKLGRVPEHILEERPTAIATQSRARRAGDAIRQDAPAAPALLREYGEALVTELRSLAPIRDPAEPFDEIILSSLGTMRPYLRQFADLIGVAVRYSGADNRAWDRVLGILEGLGSLMYRDSEATQWNPDTFDAYKVIAHEALLMVFGTALAEERFDLALETVSKRYLVRHQDGANRPATSSFTVFRQHPRSLEQRNQRLNLNRISVHADVLYDAHPRGGAPSFDTLMQADLVLFLRASGERSYENWYPLTLAYAADRFSPFPVFARSESKAYFARLAPILNVVDHAAFHAHVVEVSQSGPMRNMFDHRGFPIAYLTNLEHLGALE